MDDNILNILRGVHIVVSLLMVLVILLQSSNDGLGTVFGGGGGGGETYRTKRGLEMVLFRGTIFLAIVFVLLSGVIVKYS